MRIVVLSVGRVKGPAFDLVADFESRAARYFSFEVREVKEETATRGRTVEQVLAAEGERLLARLPTGYELVALHRAGRAWSSEQLAAYLETAGVRAAPGIAFAIGGAFGLSSELLSRATHLLSLSAMTFPHDLARLLLAEQLYRAGTILRREPYHKGTGA